MQKIIQQVTRVEHYRQLVNCIEQYRQQITNLEHLRQQVADTQHVISVDHYTTGDQCRK